MPISTRLFGGPTSPAPSPIRGYAGHKPVLDAIERRDGPGAVRLNTELLDDVARTLVRRLAGSGGTDAPG